MWTKSDLFSRLRDFEHLDLAAENTVRGKRRRPDVAWFLFRREAELERLQSELARLRYRPAGYELISIRDPKPRWIARVPIADRVVHTALVLLMEPIFLRSLSDDAYACRPGFGTHRAILRLLRDLRRFRYVIHLDVLKYFPSIDLDILRVLLERRIRDERFLEIVNRVLESGRGLYDSKRPRRGQEEAWPPPGRGLPIGSFTSQLFAAHVYLSDFDHFVKRDLHVPGYLRYCDDLFLFGNRRRKLRGWRQEVADWLWNERHLRLKHPRARILSCHGHLDALGHRITRSGVEVLPRAFERFERRVAEELYRGAPVDFERSVASSAGVLLF